MRPWLALSCSISGCLVLGCAPRGPAPATPAPRPPIEVAVLSPSWATDPAPYTVSVQPLLQGLSEGGGLHPRSIPADAACADETGCLDRVLAGSPAEDVLVVRLAALGDTVLVRAAMLDRRRGTQAAARQEVVRDATPDRVARALTALGAALAAPYAPPPPPPRPLVKTPWFWGVVTGGLVVTGAAVLAAVLASQRRPDAVITPP